MLSRPGGLAEWIAELGALCRPPLEAP